MRKMIDEALDDAEVEGKAREVARAYLSSILGDVWESGGMLEQE